MNIPTRRAVARVAATLTTATLAACSSTSQGSMPGMDHSTTPMMTTSAGTASMSTDTGRAGDIMFAQMMIPHHEQAIEMADIALGKTSASAQVKDLATTIKKAQEPEIATLRGWLTTWGAPPAASTGGMQHASGMMTETDMTKLQAAEGTEFDRLWTTMMIAHHQGAVAMAQQVLTTTTDPAVKKLAESIVTSQQAEIATMQGLL